MAYKIKTTSQYFVIGNEYAFFWWGIFALYCIGYQINRIRIYRARSKRLSDKEATSTKSRHVFDKLNYAVRIPFVTEMITVKHIIGVILFIGVNLVFIFFAPFVYGEGGYNTNLSISYFDRRAAFIGMVNWGFVFFLAQRNSILVKMSGLTFEQLIPFHRIIARIGLAEFFPHFIWRMIKGYNKTLNAKGIFAYDIEQLTGIISMFAFLIMFATSLEYIRRNYFQVFYYCHVVFLVIAIVFACWHETTCFAVFIPAIILWFFDRVIRSYNSWVSKSEIVKIDTFETNDGGVTRILFKNKLFNKFRPGQYVFTSMVLNGKNLLQYANWHPFTVSEAFRVSKEGVDCGIEERISGDSTMVEKKGDSKSVADNCSVSSSSSSGIADLRRRARMTTSEKDSTIASIHIKTLGKSTSRLFEAYQANQDIKVYLDGPYGPKLRYQDYDIVGLFATGIGATPGLAIIKDIVDKRADGVKTVNVNTIYFTWSVKTIDELAGFMDMIEYWQERSRTAVLPIQVNLSIFITRSNTSHQIKGVQVVCGERVQIDKKMQEIANAHTDQKVWIHGCGPTDFIRKVNNESVNHRFVFHNETFNF